MSRIHQMLWHKRYILQESCKFSDIISPRRERFFLRCWTKKFNHSGNYRSKDYTNYIGFQKRTYDLVDVFSMILILSRNFLYCLAPFILTRWEFTLSRIIGSWGWQAQSWKMLVACKMLLYHLFLIKSNGLRLCHSLLTSILLQEFTTNLPISENPRKHNSTSTWHYLFWIQRLYFHGFHVISWLFFVSLRTQSFVKVPSSKPISSVAESRFRK